MEPLSATLLCFAFVLLIASWVQLIIAASDDDFTWGLCSIFIPPLGYFYGLFRWEKAADSIKMACIGMVLLYLGVF